MPPVVSQREVADENEAKVERTSETRDESQGFFLNVLMYIYSEIDRCILTIEMGAVNRRQPDNCTAHLRECMSTIGRQQTTGKASDNLTPQCHPM